jgi:hypothetical protein
MVAGAQVIAMMAEYFGLHAIPGFTFNFFDGPAEYPGVKAPDCPVFAGMQYNFQFSLHNNLQK